MKAKIYLNTFSDVFCDGKLYTVYDKKARRMKSQAQIPLIQAFNGLEGKKRLLLIGNASQGKSTSLRVLAAEQLYFDRKCLLYQCRGFRTPQEFSGIASLVSESPVEGQARTVLIFDAFDELDEDLQYYFCEMLKSLDDSAVNIVVSSRYDPVQDEPEDTRASVMEQSLPTDDDLWYEVEQDSYYFDDWERDVTDQEEIAPNYDIFKSYSRAKMQPFTYEQLDSLVDRSVNRKSEYFKLLETAMLLVMHLKLEKDRMVDEIEPIIRTEVECIGRYFALVSKKLSKRGEDMGYDRLGRYIFNQRMGIYPARKESIPQYLDDILFYRKVSLKDDDGKKNHLDAINLKYLNFFEAHYIANAFLDLISGDLSAKERLTDILNDLADTYETKESLYYAGQLLMGDECPEEMLFGILNAIPEEIMSGIMKRVFALGYFNGEAKDVDGMLEFFGSQPDPLSDDFIRCHISVLSASSFGARQIDLCAEGLPVLEKIKVNNKMFTSEGDCLLRRSSKSVWLGCSRSVIPEYATSIRKHAFSYCPFLYGIRIPESVHTVDGMAFKRCDNLEEVELGEGLISLKRAAFYHCPRLTRVVFNNANMRVGRSLGYDRDAFEGSFTVNDISAPTTALRYVAWITEKKIRCLRVFQGRDTEGNPTPLTFTDVDRFPELRELIISADIEEIMEDAFYKRFNSLERIEVETGNSVYYSKDNCLIKKKRKRLMLGCKNSVIPTDGSVVEISGYAFATVKGFKHLDLGDHIAHIGEYAFAACSDLETVSVGKGLRSIAVCAFLHCNSLRSVNVSDAHVWSQTFFANVSSNPLCIAKRIVLPEGVVEIKQGTVRISSGAFSGGRGINQVVIPPSIREIGGAAFLECDDIESVYIEDLGAWCGTTFKLYSSNPLNNSARLYLNGEAVRELTVGTEIGRVSKWSFVRCKGLQEVCFEGYVSIGESAFDTCADLKRVIFKKPEIGLEANSFCGCELDVYYCGTREQWEAAVGTEPIEGVKNVFFTE